MCADTLARVFEPFFTTKGTQGTGLGLSMVHGFVKQSGGHTNIYSEEGHGTTINIYLPRVAVHAVEVIEAPPRAAATVGHETILVVEDNEALRNAVVRQLTNLGYHTLAVGDSKAAMDVIRSDATIDLLFTDVVMPGGMDGWALANAGRAIRQDLKVLLTSGYTAAAAAAATANEFSAGLLSKPYSRAELALRIRAAIDGMAR
jgi:CheY-like chemotaxis protein